MTRVNTSVNNTRLPFSYFIGNPDIIDNLKREIFRLKGYRYTCKDCDLMYINNEIKRLEKTIRYNISLSNS